MSGAITTIVLFSFSGSLAIDSPAYMAAPEVMPTKIPSRRATSRVARYAFSPFTVIISS